MSRKDRRFPPRIDLSNESKVMAKNSSSPQLLHGVENLIPTSSYLGKKRSEPHRASCRTLVSPHGRAEISNRVDPNNDTYQFGQTVSINSLTKLRSFRPQTILIQDEATQSYSLPSLQIKPSVRQTPADGSSGFQKEGFETLLSFYKDSTSKQPGQLNLKGGEQQYDKSRMGSSQSAGNLASTNSKSWPYTVIIQQSAELNSKEEVEEDAEIKRFIQGLTGALETSFSANDLEKNMGKLLNKKKEDFWREMIDKYEPDSVEICSVDMMKFTEKKRSKIARINAHEVSKQVDEHIKENNISENEAVHLMVYFYQKNGDAKKLVLNQYCFYFAKNGHFDQDLKSEKDVIIFYYLLLALYEIRVGQNIDSLKNLKPSLYRERAVNIMKGAESSSKTILEKIRPKIYNYCVIQKTYFNLNHTGTATSIYILNLLSIVASKYAKLVLVGLKKRSDSEKSLSEVKKFALKQKTRAFFAKNISLADPNNRLDTSESKSSFLIPGQRTPMKSKSGMLDLKSPVSVQRYQILNRTRMETQESINNQTNAISIMDTTKLSSENTPYVRPKYKKLTTPSLEKINQRFELSPSKITRKVDRQISTDEKSIGKFSIMLPKPKINKLISPKGGLETTLTPWGDPSSYVYDLTPKIANPDSHIHKQVVIEENRESAEGATTLRQYIASKIKKKNVLISDIVKGSKNL